MPPCKNDNTKTYIGNEPSSFESSDSKSRMLLNNLLKGKIVNEPYQAKLDKLDSSSTMMNKPGEKVKTFSSAKLGKTQRVSHNEPSPKGLGYCAHNENLYKIMVGLDNNYWYVSPVGKSRRWKRLKIPSAWFQDIKKIKSKIIKKIIKGKNYNDIIVLHNEPYDVYRNKAFEKEIKSITKLNFNFSEQGLQEIHKAHMELDNISIIKLIKKYMS